MFKINRITTQRQKCFKEEKKKQKIKLHFFLRKREKQKRK